VLYEILTGKFAFEGGTVSDTLAAILTRQPDWSALPPSVDTRVRELLERCLRKDPRERLRDIGDARIELGEAARGGQSQETRSSPLPASHGKWMSLVAAIALVAGLAGGMLIFRQSAHTEPPAFRPLTFGRGFVHSARFAPDGQTVIYGAAFRGRPLTLFSTRTDSNESRPFDLPSADVAGISRDGQMALLLGRHHQRGWLRVGTLAQVALAGGTPREILEEVYDADISPDGKQFAVVVQDGDDQVLQFPIGKELFRTHGWISQPRIAPDGKRIAFVDHRRWGDDLGEIKLAAADGKIVLLGSEQQNAQGVCWSPDGSDAWFTNGDDVAGATLFRVSPGGVPRMVLRTPSVIRVQDVAADGHVLLLTDETRVTLAGQLAGDASERVYSWWDNDTVAAISNDGATYVGTTPSIVVNGEYAMFFRRGDAPPVQLGGGVVVGMTPDAKFVFTSSLADNLASLTMRPVGAGQPRALDLGGVTPKIPPGQRLTCSSDGRRVAFIGAKRDGGRAAYILELDGGVPRAVSPEGANSVCISPDGSKVVVGDAKRGMYVVSKSGRLPVSGAPNNDVPLAWTDDGRGVLSWDGTLPPRIYRNALDSGHRELVRELVSPDPAGIIYGWLTLSPDGRYYLQRYRRVLSSVYLVTLH
jgi:Tol biopolymer transport system component